MVTGRISVVCAYYPTHGGGMEIASERLVKDLRASGNEVQWLAQADDSLPDISAGECVPFYGSDIIYKFLGVPFPLPFPIAIKTLLASFRWSDLIIIVEANFVISVIAYWLARLLGKKILLVQHVGQPSTISRLVRVIMKIGETLFTRSIVRNASAVVYVSRSVATHFEGVRSTGLTETIGHGIDVEIFRPLQSHILRREARQRLLLPTDRSVACFVGRTTRSKGIEVVRQMAERAPHWTFAIAGIGPEDPRDWKLPNVIALDQLKTSDVALLYGSSDVMILPSQSESYSLVVREAMACHCPVVCSDQILETDPRLSAYITTVAVDLTKPERTAHSFAVLLEESAKSDPSAGRDFVLRECSPEYIKRRYQRLVEGLLADTSELAK